MKLTEFFSKQKNELTDVTLMQNTRFISPSLIIRMIIGIILLIVLAQVGFYKSYLRHFPGFEDYVRPDGSQFHFNRIIHFHGMMMMSWMLMLLVQPILILKGKTRLHQLVGRLSYVLAPLVLLSMYLVTQSSYQRVLAQNDLTATARRMALDVPLIISFAVLYFLGIFYRLRPALHMRFMIGTAFIVIGAALSRTLRVLFDVSRDGSIDMSRGIMVIVVALITMIDSWRTKRISPFALVLGLVLLNKIIWNIKDNPFWQPIAGAIGKLF